MRQLVEEQKLTINELLQRAFRHRSERYLEDPSQLKLDFGSTPEAADAAAGLAEAVEEAELLVAEHQRRRRVPKKPRSEQLPEHLPRYEVEAPVPDGVKHCAEHGERKLIGHDRVETLEFERPKLKVRVTLYPKFVCENEPDCGVAQPPREPGLVEGNRYGTSVAAEIVTGKCGYHLPIYREQDYFAGCGWTVDRSTLLNLFRASAELVRPMAWYLRGEVLASGAIGTDETRVTLLLPALTVSRSSPSRPSSRSGCSPRAIRCSAPPASAPTASCFRATSASYSLSTASTCGARLRARRQFRHEVLQSEIAEIDGGENDDEQNQRGKHYSGRRHAPTRNAVHVCLPDSLLEAQSSSQRPSRCAVHSGLRVPEIWTSSSFRVPCPYGQMDSVRGRPESNMLLQEPIWTGILSRLRQVRQRRR